MAQAPTNQQRYAQSELLRRSCGRPCAAEVVLRFETLAADFGALLGRYGYPPVELPRFEVAEQPGATPAPSAELTRAVLALVEQLDAAIFDEFGYARRSGGGAAAARAARAGQRTTLTAPVLERELAHEYSVALYGAPRAFDAHTARLLWPSLLSAEARDALSDATQCGPSPRLANASYPFVLFPINFLQPGAVWLHQPRFAAAPAPHQWAEVTHCSYSWESVSSRTPMWFLHAPGSGVWLNVGRGRSTCPARARGTVRGSKSCSYASMLKVLSSEWQSSPK